MLRVEVVAARSNDWRSILKMYSSCRDYKLLLICFR
jgi:hypothetical protein